MIMGTYDKHCKDPAERARFTCIDRGRPRELNIFQDVLNCIQREEPQEINKNDRYMKGDIFAAICEHRSYYEEQMYNEIMKFCQMYKNVYSLLENQIHCMATEGMANTIRIILQDYYKIVTELNSEEPITDKPQTEFYGLTLRNALVWSREAVIILQHLSCILEKTRELKGNAMLNPMIELLKHSNPELNKITLKVFEGAAEAFCRMVWLWIIMGIINDPYDEFFIIQNDKNARLSTWHTKYYLRNDSIPKTLSSKMAKLIMDAGKMLNFLQITCGETVPYTNARSYICNLQHESHCGLLPLLIDEHGLDDLNIYFHQLNVEYERMVLIVMKEKFSLVEYFNGVYWYIFLKLSNFGRYFIDLLQPLLNESVEKLRIDLIKKHLKRAVVATSPYSSKKRRLQEAKCLTVSWKATTSTDKLCDVLQINYDPGGPLKSIFYIHENTYQKLFAFLWKKQLIQFSLCNQRKNLIYMMKKVLPDKWSCSFWRTLFWFISVMMQFICQMDYYFMYEIIEKEWNEFWDNLNSSKKINEIMDFYDHMLHKILTGTMLTEENKEARVFLNFFFVTIIDTEKLIENMEKRLLKTNGYMGNPTKFKAEINILQRNFEDGVKEFMKLILSYKQNDVLTALCDRIDFNGYYKEIL